MVSVDYAFHQFLAIPQIDRQLVSSRRSLLRGQKYPSLTMNDPSNRIRDLRQQAFNQEAELRGVLFSFLGTMQRVWNLPSDSETKVRNCHNNYEDDYYEDRQRTDVDGFTVNRINDVRKKKDRLERSAKDALASFHSILVASNNDTERIRAILQKTPDKAQLRRIRRMKKIMTMEQIAQTFLEEERMKKRKPLGQLTVELVQQEGNQTRQLRRTRKQTQRHSPTGHRESV